MIWILLLLIAVLTGQPVIGSSETASGGSGYCSPSGDVCYAVDGTDRPVLRITTVERYFPQYRLCVEPAGGDETCESFPIRKRGSSYGSSIPLHRVAPNAASGRYRATWRLGTRRLGPSLSFLVE